ncbi:MAG TPA: NADH-quinone oxidoreductase subunit L, partial [Chloroflexota bacterium]|nr:NADH-quinone oxidoreductase subunit L [Chloroflexota bacterium]
MTAAAGERRVVVCTGGGCLSSGAQAVRDALEAAGDGLRVQGSCCLGLCARGPLVTSPDAAPAAGDAAAGGAVYTEVRPEHAPAIVARARGVAAPAGAAEPEALAPDLPFFARQTRVVLADAGLVDPERLEDYVANGGYEALARALHELTPQQTIDEI